VGEEEKEEAVGDGATRLAAKKSSSSSSSSLGRKRKRGKGRGRREEEGLSRRGRLPALTTFQKLAICIQHIVDGDDGDGDGDD